MVAFGANPQEQGLQEDDFICNESAFCYQFYLMNSQLSIHQTNCSYDIYPIEEREEEHEEFIPYKRQKRLASQITSSPDGTHATNHLSQSLDCKHNNPNKFRRCKTLQKEEAKEQLRFASLEVNTTQILFPQVIHSNKKYGQQLIQRQDSKKHKLVKLQDQMKKHRPTIFKEKTKMSFFEEKPMRMINLDAVRSNVFLLQIPERQKEEALHSHITGKQLRKLMRVYKVQSSWQQDLPPRLSRNRPDLHS